MRKNIFLIILLAMVFVFVGAMNNSAKAEDDPVSVLKELKSSVRLHSWAGGDSLVNNLPSMIGTWWHSEYPVYCYFWLVVDEIENGDGILSPCDKLKLSLLPGGDYVWVHVEDVSITLWVQGVEVAKYVEFVKSFRDVGPAFVEEAIYPASSVRYFA